MVLRYNHYQLLPLSSSSSIQKVKKALTCKNKIEESEINKVSHVKELKELTLENKEFLRNLGFSLVCDIN